MATQLNLGRIVGSKFYTGAGDSNLGIRQLLTGLGITPLVGDLYFNDKSEVWQYQLVESELIWAYVTSTQGKPGTFSIAKAYPTVVAMHAGYTSDGVPLGALVVIEAGNVDDPDNAKLFRKGATEYEFIADMSGATGIEGKQGPQGPQGPKGDKGNTGDTGAAGAAATISVGTVTTGAEGSNAAVTNRGTSSAAIFDLVIPRGNTGATGAAGTPAGFSTPTASVTGLAAGSSPTVSVNSSGPDYAKVFSFLFGIPKGDTGAKGDKGDTGAAGAKGDKGDKGDTGAAGVNGITPSLSVNASGELIATWA